LLAWSSNDVLLSLLMTCRRSDATSGVMPNLARRARRMCSLSGPRAKLLARPVKQARSWRTRTGDSHSAMVATSWNSRMNCFTSPSPPKFWELRRYRSPGGACPVPYNSLRAVTKASTVRVGAAVAPGVDSSSPPGAILFSYTSIQNSTAATNVINFWVECDLVQNKKG